MLCLHLLWQWQFHQSEDRHLYHLSSQVQGLIINPWWLLHSLPLRHFRFQDHLPHLLAPIIPLAYIQAHCHQCPSERSLWTLLKKKKTMLPKIWAWTGQSNGFLYLWNLHQNQTSKEANRHLLLFCLNRIHHPVGDHGNGFTTIVSFKKSNPRFQRTKFQKLEFLRHIFVLSN